MHLGLDGFFLIAKDGVDEMIRFLANEPSAGLFFVQQHARASMPYLLDVENKFGGKIREVNLHAEDIEDSICSVRTMIELGIPIAEEMINDINKSLLIMPASRPRRGTCFGLTSRLIRSPSWGVELNNSSPHESLTTDSGNDRRGGISRSYLSTVFSSVKQKAAALRWSQLNMTTKSSQHSSSTIPSSKVGHAIPAAIDAEGDKVPLPCRSFDDQLGRAEGSDAHDISSVRQDFDRFKSEREAKYEEWLQGPKNSGFCTESQQVIKDY